MPVRDGKTKMMAITVSMKRNRNFRRTARSINYLLEAGPETALPGSLLRLLQFVFPGGENLE
jgi:hypothetical protein